jgi:hypothetical protein
MGLAGWLMMDEEMRKKQEEYEQAVKEKEAAGEPTGDIKKPEKTPSPLQALQLQQEPKEEVKEEKPKSNKAE